MRLTRGSRAGQAKRYDGDVAVVTGATSGIGRRLAVDLAERGATVVGLARRTDVLDELRTTTAVAETATCDVADTDRYRKSLGEIEAAHGRIDVLVNCAGVSERAEALGGDVDLYEQLMAVNYFGPVAGSLAVLPGMVVRGRGIVVNVSSDVVRTPVRAIAAYAGSKGALSAFTESVAHEVGDRGVHVHVLYPGWVPTPMGLAGHAPPPKIARRTEEQVSRLALERMGGPSIELNAVSVAVMATFARSFLPRLHRRIVASQQQ